ncbi:MAG TPA: hypothetical protein EYP24_05585, partial [bacterium (Candidatus Stahlbacteria)]|nr:hypothetical protein [Candidatus Stahlbacteria bacterium]
MVLSIFLAVTGISLTRWIDPLGRGPVDFKTWSSVHKSYNTKVTTILTTNKGRGLVDVVVNGGIYIEIKDEITRFISDLTSEGYQVQLDTTTNITAPALRDHLGSLPGLEGAILVGEMPLAWFEDDEFGSWEEFPIDLYFADLDG